MYKNSHILNVFHYTGKIEYNDFRILTTDGGTSYCIYLHNKRSLFMNILFKRCAQRKKTPLTIKSSDLSIFQAYQLWAQEKVNIRYDLMFLCIFALKKKLLKNRANLNCSQNQKYNSRWHFDNCLLYKLPSKSYLIFRQ